MNFFARSPVSMLLTSQLARYFFEKLMENNSSRTDAHG